MQVETCVMVRWCGAETDALHHHNHHHHHHHHHDPSPPMQGRRPPLLHYHDQLHRRLLLRHQRALARLGGAIPSVIFPWRRGEPTRSSGRCSPAPFDGQSQPQSAPPCPSQSSISLRPEEATTNGEARSKDSVWWRGRPGSGGSGGGGGGTRTARKEKASSSPAFRRASLSHSEWDIRRDVKVPSYTWSRDCPSPTNERILVS